MSEEKAIQEILRYVYYMNSNYKGGWHFQYIQRILANNSKLMFP